MKKIFKLSLIFVLSSLTILSTAYADENDDRLEADLYRAVRESVDGKLDYQVNIMTVYGPSDINIYMANIKKDQLPSASTIKPMIGLALMDKNQKGEISYSKDIKKDLDLSLRLSDNEATNRLIKSIGGFDEINSSIKKISGNERTQLNRLMLTSGKENTANAKDLAQGFYEIYRSDDKIAKDMVRSMSNSSRKRVKLLKNIDPSHKSMNKTGELVGIENDLALVETGKQAYIISVLTQNKGYMDSNKQVKLLNDLGEKVGRAYDTYEKAYNLKEEAKEKNLEEGLDTIEKKLAYAVYQNQIFINAAEILLESGSHSVDGIREKLIIQVNNSEKLLARSKNTLASLSKSPIENEEDMLVNLVRLIYTDSDDIKDLNKELALAFYSNKAAVRAGEILLQQAPRTSLNIRRTLLNNMKNAEEAFKKMDRYFEKLNEKNQ
ncbi:serine hydrolase [uncultured Anaerococcus sp.]|uniref:serine hydrolase n=1 Tax=uncultured Anaerococcus sp. TaxID=293428 RepID=UPI0025EEB6F9|nr:serine hydrolase [uncultured Anaerococcus sp.]